MLEFVMTRVVWAMLGAGVAGIIFANLKPEEPTLEQKRELVQRWLLELDEDTRQRARIAAQARERFRP